MRRMLQGGPTLNVTHINNRHWTRNLFTSLFEVRVNFDQVKKQSYELTVRAS